MPPFSETSVQGLASSFQSLCMRLVRACGSAEPAGEQPLTASAFASWLGFCDSPSRGGVIVKAPTRPSFLVEPASCCRCPGFSLKPVPVFIQRGRGPLFPDSRPHLSRYILSDTTPPFEGESVRQGRQPAGEPVGGRQERGKPDADAPDKLHAPSMLAFLRVPPGRNIPESSLCKGVATPFCTRFARSRVAG